MSILAAYGLLSEVRKEILLQRVGIFTSHKYGPPARPLSDMCQPCRCPASPFLSREAGCLPRNAALVQLTRLLWGKEELPFRGIKAAAGTWVGSGGGEGRIGAGEKGRAVGENV